MRPKILVGAPIFDGSAYDMPEYLKALRSLTYPNVQHLLVDNSRSPKFFEELKKKNVNVIRKFYDLPDPKARIVAARNVIAQKVIEKCDYFLSLEQDVIPPKDVIERLLAHGKQIISGVYCNVFKNAKKKQVMLPILYRDLTSKEQEEIQKNLEKFQKMNPETYAILKENNFNFSVIQKQMTLQEMQGKELIKVKSCGLGCVLIHKSVLEKVKFRLNPNAAFDDMVFCEDARKNGFDIYTDASVMCKHLIKNKPWKWAMFHNV